MSERAFGRRDGLLAGPLGSAQQFWFISHSFYICEFKGDAKEDTHGLVNKFQAMTRALLVAKRQGALDMAKKLVEAQETVENAKKTLASKEAQLAAALTLMAQHGLTVPLAPSE